MNNKISILFYGKKSRITSDNLLPTYLRVTISGKRFEICTNRNVSPSKWSVEAGRVKGNTEEARSVYTYMDILRSKVYGYQQELLQERKLVTVETLRIKWLGVEEKPILLLEVFEKHNGQVEQLIGKVFALGTLQRYKISLVHTRNFIKWKYSAEDIDVKKLSYRFITDYAFWLKTVRGCAHNTTMKYLANFKKVIHICLKHGWLERDPFLGFKMNKKEVVREYLTEAELQRMAAKEFAIDRLGQVRDVFLFSCYTGLAYVDVQKLKRSEIREGMDGERWIFTRRQKTETPSRIPLLPPALDILDRYQEHPQCLYQDRVLPVLSNQKMNAYLKEIAALCGIQKQMTFHIARHTFATTVTLSNGVPIETVSRMLGHRNLRTTQHYAKILDQKVSNDMQQLRDRLTRKA